MRRRKGQCQPARVVFRHGVLGALSDWSCWSVGRAEAPSLPDILGALNARKAKAAEGVRQSARCAGARADVNGAFGCGPPLLGAGGTDDRARRDPAKKFPRK